MPATAVWDQPFPGKVIIRNYEPETYAGGGEEQFGGSSWLTVDQRGSAHCPRPRSACVRFSVQRGNEGGDRHRDLRFNFLVDTVSAGEKVEANVSSVYSGNESLCGRVRVFMVSSALGEKVE